MEPYETMEGIKMKVWVCKAYHNECSPDAYQIAHVFDNEQKAKDWKNKHDNVYYEYEEYEIE